MAVSGTDIQTTSKPGTVSSYWDEKIRRTQERDREQEAALRQAGWEVLRFWDFEVKESVESCAELIAPPCRDAAWDDDYFAGSLLRR